MAKQCGAISGGRLRQHVEGQARALFPAGLYEACCASIPRCPRMLACRYTVRHVASHLRGLTSQEELRSFLHTKANQQERILIAWSLVRIIELACGDSMHLPSAARTERLLHLDGLGLCQLGTWLHLIHWPEAHCPTHRDGDCGRCSLEPAK